MEMEMELELALELHVEDLLVSFSLASASWSGLLCCVVLWRGVEQSSIAS